jgi:hypothetical protein
MEGVKVEKGIVPPPMKKPSWYYRGSISSVATVKAEPEFRGRNEGLNGHVFD